MEKEGDNIDLYYQDLLSRERIVKCDAKHFPRKGDRYYAPIEELQNKKYSPEIFTIHSILFDSTTGIYRV